MDPFLILGVAEDASPEDVLARYRRMAKETHPDLNPGVADAAERFSNIRKAYELILARREAAEAMRAAGPRMKQANDWGRPVRRDVRKEVKIGLAEAFTGGSIRVSGSSGPCRKCSGDGFHRSKNRVVCHVCFGSGVSGYGEKGMIRASVTCSECGGTGHTMKIMCDECFGHGSTKSSPAEIEVLPGCRDGTSFVVKNGASDPAANVIGDLEVVIRVNAHERYSVSGDNLETDAEINVWDAAMGTSIFVPGLVAGGFNLSVPPGTQPGARFRMRGRGMPNGDERGDLYVTVNVRIPTATEPRLREAFEKVRQAANGGSR